MGTPLRGFCPNAEGWERAGDVSPQKGGTQVAGGVTALPGGVMGLFGGVTALFGVRGERAGPWLCSCPSHFSLRSLFLTGSIAMATAGRARPPGPPRYTNRLINEKSPYLLQHAHNPVDW